MILVPTTNFRFIVDSEDETYSCRYYNIRGDYIDDQQQRKLKKKMKLEEERNLQQQQQFQGLREIFSDDYYPYWHHSWVL